MVRLISIDHNELINHTIKYITYNNTMIIFVMDNNMQIMMISPCGQQKGKLFTKNNKDIDHTTIKDLKIKDIGWESSSFPRIDNLFIVSSDGSIYRTHCFIADVGIMYDCLYDYIQYKYDKLEFNKKF